MTFSRFPLYENKICPFILAIIYCALQYRFVNLSLFKDANKLPYLQLFSICCRFRLLSFAALSADDRASTSRC